MKVIHLCKSIVGRNAVAYGCKHFDITKGTCNCKNNCENKYSVIKKENSK